MNMNENEVKVYTVATGNFPVIPNKGTKKIMKALKEMDGFIGAHPHAPYGTLLLFDTERNARMGRAKLINMDVHPVGNNICEAFIDKGYLNHER